MTSPLAISSMDLMSRCTCFDYDDVVYDKLIGTKQYKVCLAAPNKELGLESLSDTRWVRKLTFFWEILKRAFFTIISDYFK